MRCTTYKVAPDDGLIQPETCRASNGKQSLITRILCTLLVYIRTVRWCTVQTASNWDVSRIFSQLLIIFKTVISNDMGGITKLQGTEIRAMIPDIRLLILSREIKSLFLLNTLTLNILLRVTWTPTSRYIYEKLHILYTHTHTLVLC